MNMPSVGMRLTTRVFGIVKGADGARVLRSGRRLWPDSDDVKCFRRGSGGRDEWLRILGNRGNGDGGGGACKKKVWDNKSKEEDNTVMDIGDHPPPEVVPEPVNAQVVDKMWGLVYTRKRKRLSTPQYPALPVLKELDSVKRYGIYFTRRQRRRTNHYENGDSKLDLTGNAVLEGSFSSPILSVLGESSSIPSFLACFLNYVLRHMKKARVRLSDLSAFLSTEPMALVYSSQGIQFSQVLPATGTSMICNIYRPRQFTPMLTVYFSAVPHCFIYMHMSMFLRNNWQPSVLKYNSMDVDTGDSMLDDDDVVNRRAALFLSNFHSSKLSSRAQHRNSFNLGSIQKKRSTMRSRRSVWGSSGGNLLERSFAMVRLPQDAGSSCSANILVTESEKCYREEGAKVVLEMSSSGEWFLIVKKDQITRYSHRAQSVMRSWTCNKVNHAILWTANNDWKLEFPSRQDWAIFKDLYKECSDRNAPLSPNLKSIPIPGVHEVLDYEDSNHYAFLRPTSYIKLNNNEVERALAKRTAIYDMDSEDEEWLKKFNNDVVLGDGIAERVSDDNFELMVDAFEKTLYCKPDDCFDENAAINLCLDLGRREVVQAVYNYWLRKRKLKRSALLRIFQAHQQKKVSLGTRSVQRKRRSSKRHAKQYGRGKQPNVLQAIAAEQAAALEYQNAMQKVEEAKASLERYNEIALRKRKRAQALMENADLATYKATMAVRITDAAQSTDSVDVSCTHFLD